MMIPASAAGARAPAARCLGLPIILMGDNFQKDPPSAMPWYRVLAVAAAPFGWSFTREWGWPVRLVVHQ